LSEEIYVIDGSAYIYRAYHAIAPLSNSSGVPTHAVLGFVNMVNRLLREKSPKYLAIAFDSKGPVFRHEIYREYKANRPPMPEDLRPQIPYIMDFVRAARILRFEQPEVEADDLIASITRKFTSQGHRVVIVSGDKDLLQLVSERTVMWDPMKDKEMNVEEIRDKYCVETGQLLDYFALVGDSSDNVPGIPGVGPKTARKLIGSFGSLDGLYQNVSSLKASKMKEKIIENKEMAYLSRQLIRLRNDVAIPQELSDFAIRGSDEDKLRAIYEELEFTSLLKGIEKLESVPTSGFEIVTGKEELAMLESVLSESNLIALDTETTSLEARHAGLVGISLATTPEKVWYIPLNHLDQAGNRLEGQLDEEHVRSVLAPFLTSNTKVKIGHNLKYDYTVLKTQWEVALSGRLADTLVAAHLLEAGGRSLKLDDLCLERGIKLTTFGEVTGGDKRENSFSYVPVNKAADYSCEDVYGTLLLWKEFEPLLAERGLLELYDKIEMVLLPILAEMESVGIALDSAVLDSLSTEFSQEIAGLERQIFAVAGHEFNINSPKQLADVLFVEQKLPYGRKTKTGYSTDVKVLERLAGKHELPRLILRYRSLMKLQSTYVEKLSKLKDPITSRIHTSFNQAVTATGRLSSSEPNLQNIPIRTEEGGRIRAAFVSGPGKVFLSADYSQIDLRVLAHYSQDAALLAAFNAGDDIHTRTAAEIFNVSPLLVTPEMRRVAKSINFGIVYGMSSFGLSNQLDIGRKEAQRFIDKYFKLYSGVKKYMHDIVELARSQGYVTTLSGRRRRAPDINSTNRNRRELAERMAINTPIQGTAADIIKLAMIRCRQKIAEQGLPAQMILQVHDELVFEIDEDRVSTVTPILKAAMEQAMSLDVPLVVNTEVGRDLAK
jgi:DNA polymerase-1